MRATFSISGTVAIRSSPEMAGTGAFFTGSIFIAMVPPVAINLTTGFAGASATCAGLGGSGVRWGAAGGGVCGRADVEARKTARVQAIDWRMRTSTKRSSTAPVTLAADGVQAGERLQAAGRPAAR